MGGKLTLGAVALASTLGQRMNRLLPQ